MLYFKITLGKAKELGEIIDFFRGNYDFVKDWPDKVVVPWMNWYIESGFCVIGRECFKDNFINMEGQIKSLLIGRPVACIKRGATETFYQERDGNIFFVDTVLTEHLSTIRPMTDMMVKSVGVKDYLAFTRDHGNMQKIKVYKLERFLKFYAPLSTT